jgi:S-adenosylmethionine:tRNA ribosyltransferase-isomerase
MATGHIPLPPYIASKRGEDDQDRKDYQTIYAREDGAVAAPTAGLHFTPDLFARLDARGIERHFVTLHVGAGTFLPVKADDTTEHKMHSEIGHVSAETADALTAVRARGGRIVSVGTTSLRLLESAVDEGRSHQALVRTDRHLHHARLYLSCRGRAYDKLSPAAFDAVHAGLGILGS